MGRWTPPHGGCRTRRVASPVIGPSR
jgi:hypothetical protein